MAFKLLHSESDISLFTCSQGYHDLLSFILILNDQIRRKKTNMQKEKNPVCFLIFVLCTKMIGYLSDWLCQLKNLVREIEPQKGIPGRFGNVACVELESKSKFM